MDLSGKFDRQNMLKSTLIETKGPNLVFLEDFEKKEDIKLYSQLPDYDDVQAMIWEKRIFYAMLI